MLAKLQRHFVHQHRKESSYFKLFGPVYTQSYHGSPHVLQLYTLSCPQYIFLGPGLSPLSLSFGAGLIGNSGMRFFGRCWVKIALCLQWRDVWCCMDPFSMQAKAGGVMGYLLGWEEHFFPGWIWGKQQESSPNPAVRGIRQPIFRRLYGKGNNPCNISGKEQLLESMGCQPS